MTVGERLQQYRKNLGLSQEELGQRLLVSRQTISQWETDQTMPTLDNLMRLKELYDVSIDTLLSGEESAEQKEAAEPALESYKFAYTEAELQKLSNGKIWSWLKRPLILLSLIGVYIVLSFIFGYGQMSLFAVIFNKALRLAAIAIFLIVLIVLIIRFCSIRSHVKRKFHDIALYEYTYYLYENRFTLQTKNSDGSALDFVVPYVKIMRAQRINAFLILTDTQENEYLFRERDLSSSAITRLTCELSSQKRYTKADGVWRVVSILSFVFAIVSYPVSALCANISIQDFSGIWKVAFFLPIPIASIVIGCIMKSKGLRYRKNLIAGIIITCVMITVSCIPLLVYLLVWMRR